VSSSFARGTKQAELLPVLTLKASFCVWRVLAAGLGGAHAGGFGGANWGRCG
jgi:hypothetical protein